MLRLHRAERSDVLAGRATDMITLLMDDPYAFWGTPILPSGRTPGADDDADTLLDTADNCPQAANRQQEDTDQDGLGNACDATPTGDSDVDVRMSPDRRRGRLPRVLPSAGGGEGGRRWTSRPTS